MNKYNLLIKKGELESYFHFTGEQWAIVLNSYVS